MRRAIHILLVCLLGGTASLHAGTEGVILNKNDFLTWPRAEADQFGCFLEKSFGYRDQRFNCNLKNYQNKGDPCHNTKAYAEGPTFPTGIASKVFPGVQDIRLTWEHGELQMVVIELKKVMSDHEARAFLKLPKQDSQLESNVMSISVQPQRNSTSVLLQGFDHMGSGDIDCSESH